MRPARVLLRAAGGLSVPVAVGAGVSVLPYLAGRDPALAVLRARAVERTPDAAALEAVRAELDLPDGPVDAATSWLWRLTRGDLGTSWVSGDPVAPTVLSGLGVSLTLALAAVAVAAATALVLTAPVLRRPFGRYGGERARLLEPGTLAIGAAPLLAAVPEFLVAALGIWLARLGPSWPHTSGWAGPADVVLPAAAVGLPLGGVLAVVAQSAARSSLGEPWVRTWASAGFAPITAEVALMRRAVAGLGPLLGLGVAGLLAGSVVVETVFAIPGLGRIALLAVLGGDLPMVQASMAAVVAVGTAVAVSGDPLRRVLRRSEPPAPVPTTPGTGAVPWTGLAVGAVLLAVLLVGVRRDPLAASLSDRLLPPGPGSWLGTDHLGRDVLARLAHGFVLTVGPAVLVSAAALVVALVAVLFIPRSGAWGRVGNALPAVVVGLLVATVTGPGELTGVIAVLVVSWVPLALHGTSLLAELRTTEYVAAARVLGLGPGRLLVHEILPGLLGPLAAHTAARVAHVALALTGMAFLGLGPAPPSPQWGALLHDALPHVDRAPWVVLTVGAALLLTALAVSSLSALVARPTRRPRKTSRPRT